MPRAASDHPLWETLVMVASFIVVWAWLLARHALQVQNASRYHPLSLGPGWALAQAAAVAALVVVLVRRTRRIKKSLAENSRIGFGGPPKRPARK